MRFHKELWIESDGLRWGKSEIEILSSLLKTGSISATAGALSLSYGYVRAVVRRASRVSPPIVRVDEKSPGVVEITDKGRRVIEEYRRMERAVENLLRYGPAPSLTVDGVVLSGERILLVKRGRPPFENMWALPGGFVKYGERLEEAVLREVEEETGLQCEVERFLGFADSPERDPRGHTISAIFLLRVVGGEVKGGDDAAEAKFFHLSSLPPLAFDHRSIVERVTKEVL